jgi:hypothetical protein
MQENNQNAHGQSRWQRGLTYLLAAGAVIALLASATELSASNKACIGSCGQMGSCSHLCDCLAGQCR